jgi:hypothetical protein
VFDALAKAMGGQESTPEKTTPTKEK